MANKKEEAQVTRVTEPLSTPLTDKTDNNISEEVICPLCDERMEQEGMDLFCPNCGYCTTALNIGFKYLTAKRRQK